MALLALTLTGCGSSDTNSSSRDKPALVAQSQGQSEGAENGQLQAAAAVPALPTETYVPVSPTPTSTEVGGTAVVTTTSTSTPTNISASATVVIATHVAYATAVAQFREQLRTSVALTHAPTITPGTPQAMPSPTPKMGMLPGCGNTSTSGPQAVNCWRGVVDGHIVEVYAGREGSDGDPTQGIVRMHIRGQQGNGSDTIYQTPDRVGAVRIASVDGTQFTLETVQQPTPQVFMFDLAGRRWLSP